MDELVEKVREALAAEYPGAPNGRVRDVPDRRAIRWYTTIGLVDKPSAMRGRTALYGPRHLQQLVAIKRRQAAGRSLADIQVEFAHLSPDQLGALSQVPESLLVGPEAPRPDVVHRRFWADQPTVVTPTASTHIRPAADAHTRSKADAHTPPEADARIRPETATPAPLERAAPARPEIAALALGAGVILLVPHALDDRDRDAITAAAAPLLALLADRGLTDGSPS